MPSTSTSACAVTLFASVAYAGTETSLPGPGVADSHQAYLARIRAAEGQSLNEALAAYDAYIARRPKDAIAAVERCKLITGTLSEDEETDDARVELQKACMEKLAAEYALAPLALRYRLEFMWGDDAIEFAERILADPKIRWTDADKGFIYDREAMIRSGEGSTRVAADLARRAMQLDPTIDATTIIANQLLADGKRDDAIALLCSRVEGSTEPYKLTVKARALADAGAYDRALWVLEAAAKLPNSYVDPVLHASVLEGTGQTTLARQKYAEAKGSWNQQRVLARLFAIDLAGGDAAVAWQSYQALRDLGWRADPVARLRLGLAWKFPLSAWRARDLLGLLTVLAALVVIAGFPLLWILPVHYLYLWRKDRQSKRVAAAPESPAPAAPAAVSELPASAPPDPQAFAPPPAQIAPILRGPLSPIVMPAVTAAPEPGPWDLRHLWLVSAVVLFSQMAAFYFFAYGQLEVWFSEGGQPDTKIGTTALASAGVASFVMDATVLALLLRPRERLRILGRGVWSIKNCMKAAGLGYLILLTTGAIFRVFERFFDLVSTPPAAAGETSSLLVLRAIRDTCGTEVLLLLVAVVVPVTEEFLFRSVILDTYSRYMRFGLANLLQSLLFMVVHDDPAKMPQIFVLGILAGILRQRSGGLLSCIALHAGNNLVAVMLLVRLA